MTVLTAQFDKGGDVNHPVVVEAGYIASDVQWDNLGTKWKEAMKDAEVKDFHMSDFMTGSKRPDSEFNETDWPQTKKDKFIGKLNPHHQRLH